MEINTRVDYGLLRNPLFVAIFLLVSVAPEVVLFCSDINGNALGSCSREVVNASFVQNSFLSSSLVLLAFESQRIYLRKQNLLALSKSLQDFWRVNFGLIVVSVITFFAFVLIRFLIRWISGNEFYPDQRFLTSTIVKVLGIVFVSNYTLHWYSEMIQRKHPLKKVILAGAHHNTKVELKDVQFFNKEGRSYFLKTSEGHFPIKSTLKELESKLPKAHFFRINRSVIVNMHEIEDYHFWEHEKYILKIKTGEEFIVTRKRVLELKKELNSRSNSF